MVAIQKLVETTGPETSPVQLRGFLHQIGIGRNASPDTELTEAQCLAFWLYSLLLNIPTLHSEQRQLLFAELFEDIDNLLLSVRCPESTPMLAIADLQYAVWESRDRWLCLKTGAHVPVLDNIFVTTAYNLKTLFRRNKAKIQE